MSDKNLSLPTWEETTEVASQSQELPSWDDTTEVSDASDSTPPVEMSDLNVAKRGLTKGAALDFNDEISGGIDALTKDTFAEDWNPVARTAVGGALALPLIAQKGADLITGKSSLEQLLEDYRQGRDKTRQLDKQASETSPDLFLGSEIVGSVASPANFVPGLNFSAPAKAAFYSKPALQAAMKTGLAQGATQGLGMSEADLTKGNIGEAAVDTAIGAGLGATAGPAGQLVIGGTGAAIGAGVDAGKKVIGSAMEKGEKIADTLVPSIVRSYKAGKANANLTPEQFFEQTFQNYEAMGDKAQAHYKATRQGFEDQIEFQEAEILKNKAEQIKLKSDQLLAEGRVNEANKLVSDFQKQVDDLSKQNAKLNKEAEKAIADQEKAMMKEFEARSKAEFDAQQEAKKATLAQAKADKKAKEEAFKLEQQEVNKLAAQNKEDIVFDAANSIDTGLTKKQQQLTKDYTDVSDALTQQGVKFDSKEISQQAFELIENSNLLTNETKDALKLQINDLIPQRDLNLTDMKALLSNIRNAAKQASDAGNNQLASVLNATVNQSKEIGYHQIKDIKTLKKLRNLDKDYSNYFRAQDYINAEAKKAGLDTINFLNQLLPDANGVLSAKAKKIMEDMTDILSSSTTKAGKKFAGTVDEAIQQVGLANESKLATKFNKEMLKQDEGLQKIAGDIANLEQEIATATPRQIEAPELQNVGPQRQDLNEQKIVEIQGEIDKVKTQIFNDNNTSVEAQLAKSEKAQELDRLQATLDAYKEATINKGQVTGVDDILAIPAKQEGKRKSQVLGKISKYTDEGIDAGTVKAREVVNDLVDQKILTPDELNKFKNDNEVSGYIQRKVDQGSSSDRGILLKFLPRAAYNTGAKMSKINNKLFSKSPVEVTEAIGRANPTYGKMLQEALIRGDSAYKATLYTLQQRDEGFRKILQDSNLNEEED